MAVDLCLKSQPAKQQHGSGKAGLVALGPSCDESTSQLPGKLSGLK